MFYHICVSILYQKEADRKGHTRYYLPKVEIKDYYVIIDERNFFDHPVHIDTMKTS